MTLRWSQQAARDLRESRDRLSRHDPGAARRAIAEVRKAARAADRWPRAGRVVPEVNRPDLRELPVLRRYRLVYRVGEGEDVIIVTVFDGRRLLRKEDL